MYCLFAYNNVINCSKIAFESFPSVIIYTVLCKSLESPLNGSESPWNLSAQSHTLREKQAVIGGVTELRTLLVTHTLCLFWVYCKSLNPLIQYRTERNQGVKTSAQYRIYTHPHPFPFNNEEVSGRKLFNK